ncbi:hypothetical protein QBC46DRAFT_387074 [Diplogelasinospora grovesii]|uniref:F-box domain-containing protein n=1 Tax=Diplogelasinospora grovesii TaxID=303347 RepID=A0AAN6S470_9PEZI|nr:hypothetical protein QBC46DRAFT_387074 [Diplogelasinospora grovesii]
MDYLPVELLRLIFECCDASAIRTLRLVSMRLAIVGLEYLLEPHFNAVEWRDDIKRLHSIASHERLRHSTQSVTFNFSRVDEYNARHASFFQHWLHEPEERSAVLQDAWIKYYELEEKSRGIPPFHTRSTMVEESFKRLSNLKELEVTYTKCPYDIDALRDVFLVRNCRKRDRTQACKNANAIVSAIRHVRLNSLVIDQLPLEIFRMADDRKHWFDCARSFASLSRLDLVLDPPQNLLPNSRFRAINGLGHVLQFSPNLTHLSLGFHTYHAPMEKFNLSFRALLGDSFVYEKLTDLKLEGLSCAEDDLRAFLVKHGQTLERLRLGGRGLAKPHELSIGGVHLYEGSFRSLFRSLQGKLPKLQRFHMEGDMEAGTMTPNSRELYKFHAVTDDTWAELGDCGSKRFRNPSRKTIDCLAIERYLLHGGEYPRVLVPGGADD